MQNIQKTAILVACLTATLPGLAEAQARAECEYRNPDYPQWDFRRGCTLEITTRGDKVTTKADVGNGATITFVQEGTDAPSYSVNGHRARLIEDGASRCFLTIEDEETACIHGADAVAALPEAPEAPASETADAPTSTVTATPIGGGEKGQCLSWVAHEGREGLIEQGACTRRTDCAEVEGQGGMTCLIDLAWASGRETVITRKEGVYTLDGAVAAPDARGCLTDTGEGLHFCFATGKMAAADYPEINLAPAPEETAPMAAAVVTETAPTAAPAVTGNRCSFLRDAVEVSSWGCTETIECDDPICTVQYVFENGTEVTLDTADGKVMLMNGAKANPATWARGAVVDVTRPGAPYTFRFTPAAE